MSDNAPITVVNIISVSFSGSTWLGLMLGTHPRALFLGEMKRIRPGDELGECALHGGDCPLWSRFDREAEEDPFEQLARLSGYRMFAINNSRKFAERRGPGEVHHKFIHLIRDGRAVTASMLRKGYASSMWHAARVWKRNVRRNRRLINRQGEADRLLVRYEDLLADKPGTLTRICRFLGLAYEPAMTEFWRGEHHPLGGNMGTMLSVVRRNETADADRADRITHVAENHGWDVGYYHHQDPARFRDERWKGELSDRDLRMFGLVAGRMNRWYGYPPSLDRDGVPGDHN